MIIDLERFVTRERPYWQELEGYLDKHEERSGYRMSVDEAQRFVYLYERCSSDLARLAPGGLAADVRSYVESLVARAYAEIHEGRRDTSRPRPVRWFLRMFPQIFRRNIRPFWLSAALTISGVLFGAGMLAIEPASKRAIMPFQGLLDDPRVRVQKEREGRADQLEGKKSAFSAQLMTHNTRVAVFTMALGVTFGAGTIVLLFYNGVILGAVCFDYIRAGESAFLAGWLLPHGAVEIPAILLGGQAGLMLAGAMIGWRTRETRAARLRRIGPDLVGLISGAGILLVWAGIVEAFFSQYHEPYVPYALKIAFGIAELVLLTLFLVRSGSQNA
jgi:uncharacterized membrane protein SpoIIM required for sporulation